MSNNKFITMDCEGDGLSQYYNKQVFPFGNHYDPETRLWCITFASGSHVQTFAHKLPSTVRTLPGTYKDRYGNFCNQTRAFHEVSSKLPGFCITANCYSGFLNQIESRLSLCYNHNIDVYAKGYGTNYLFDKDCLRDNFNKFGISTSALDCLHNSYEIVSHNNWKPTYKQMNAGEYVDNQQYMLNGIQHNREDAVQLYKAIQTAL